MQDYQTASLEYLNRILRSVAGPKAILVDDEVREVISASFTFTELVAHDVFLVDLVPRDASIPRDLPASTPQDEVDFYKRPILPCFAAIVVVRPTDLSIRQLCNELGNPQFREYLIYFTAMVEQSVLQLIVNSDVFDVVTSLEEAFIDLQPVTDETSMIPLKGEVLSAIPSSSRQQQPTTVSLAALTAGAAAAAAGGGGTGGGAKSRLLGMKMHRNPTTAVQFTTEDHQRTVQGIIALLLSSKRLPAVRYRAGSRVAEKLGNDLSGRMKGLKQVFFDLKAKDCVLLILDRQDDVLTPLLTPWTYEAMIHEVLGISSHVVDLGDAAEAPAPAAAAAAGGAGGSAGTAAAAAAGSKEVLSAIHDPFFAKHRFSDYETFVAAVRQVVVTFKELYGKSTGTSASIAELKSLWDSMAEAQAHSTQMTRHMNIANIISREIRDRKLVDLSVLEQNIATMADFAGHSEYLKGMAKEPDYDVDDVLRLTVMYDLRYEGRTDAAAVVAEVVAELRKRGLTEDQASLLTRIKKYGGQAARIPGAPPLFPSQSIFGAFKSAMDGFRDEPAFKTTHRPHLQGIIERVASGTLPLTDYPYSEVPGSFPAPPAETKMKEIFIFIVGGATYQEAAVVRQANMGQLLDPVQPPTIGASVVAGTIKVVTFGYMGGGASTQAGGEPKTTLAADGSVISAAGAGGSSGPKMLDVRVALCSTGMLNTKQFIAGIT